MPIETCLQLPYVLIRPEPRNGLISPVPLSSRNVCGQTCLDALTNGIVSLLHATHVTAAARIAPSRDGVMHDDEAIGISLLPERNRRIPPRGERTDYADRAHSRCPDGALRLIHPSG